MSIRLIAGLGNDEDRYRSTFHNVGFGAVQALADRLHLRPRDTFREYLIYRSPAADVLLITPRSYMNTCGPNIAAALRRESVAPKEVLIVLDDFALPAGRLRLRRSGSAGGHNGLKSVIEALGTTEFPRLRVGIGPVPDGEDPKDYVLRRQPAERLRKLAERTAEALETALTEGLETAMNRFNPI